MSRPVVSLKRETQWELIAPALLLPWATVKFVGMMLGFIVLSLFALYTWNSSFYYIPTIAFAAGFIMIPMQQSQKPILRILEDIWDVFVFFADRIVFQIIEGYMYFVSPSCFAYNFILDIMMILINLAIRNPLELLMGLIFPSNPFQFTLDVVLTTGNFPFYMEIDTSTSPDWIVGAYGKSEIPMMGHETDSRGYRYYSDQEIFRRQFWVQDPKNASIVYAHPLVDGRRKADTTDPLLETLVYWLGKADEKKGRSLDPHPVSGGPQANFRISIDDFDRWTDPRVNVDYRRSMTERFLVKTMDEVNGLMETQFSLWDGFSFEGSEPAYGARHLRDDRGQPISPWSKALGLYGNWREIGVIQLLDKDNMISLDKNGEPNFRMMHNGYQARINPFAIFDIIASFFFDLLDGFFNFLKMIFDIVFGIILQLLELMTTFFESPAAFVSGIMEIFFHEFLGIDCLEFDGFVEFAISLLDCICGPLSKILITITGGALKRWFNYEKANGIAGLPQAFLGCIGLGCIDIGALTSNPLTFAATFLGRSGPGGRKGCLGLPKQIVCCMLAPWGCIMNLIKELLNCPCKNNWKTITLPQCKWAKTNDPTEPFKCVIIWLVNNILKKIAPGGAGCEIKECLTIPQLAGKVVTCLWNIFLSAAKFMGDLVDKIFKKMFRKIKKKLKRRSVRLETAIGDHSEMSLLNQNVRDAALDDVILSHSDRLQDLDQKTALTTKALSELMKHLKFQNALQSGEIGDDGQLNTIDPLIMQWREVRDKTDQIHRERVEYQRGEIKQAQDKINTDRRHLASREEFTDDYLVPDNDPVFLADLECFRVHYLLTGQGWDPLYPPIDSVEDDVDYDTAFAVDHVMVELNRQRWNPLVLIQQYLMEHGRNVDHEEIQRVREEDLRQARELVSSHEGDQTNSWALSDAKNLIQEEAERKRTLDPTQIKFKTSSSSWNKIEIDTIRGSEISNFKDPSHAIAVIQRQYGDKLAILSAPKYLSGPEKIELDIDDEEKEDYLDESYNIKQTGNVRGKRWVARQIERVFGKNLHPVNFRNLIQVATNERLYKNPFLRLVADRFDMMSNTLRDWAEYRIFGPDPFIIDGVRSVVKPGTDSYAGDGPYTMFPPPPSWIHSEGGRRVRFYRTHDKTTHEDHAYAVHLESLRSNPYYAGLYKVMMQLSYAEAGIPTKTVRGNGLYDAANPFNTTENPGGLPDELWEAMSANDGKPMYYVGRMVSAGCQFMYGLSSILHEVSWNTEAYSFRFPSIRQLRSVISQVHIPVYADDLISAGGGMIGVYGKSLVEKQEKEARKAHKDKWAAADAYLDEFDDTPHPHRNLNLDPQEESEKYEEEEKAFHRSRDARHAMLIQLDVAIRVIVSRIMVPKHIDAILDVLAERSPTYAYYAEIARERIELERAFVDQREARKGSKFMRWFKQNLNDNNATNGDSDDESSYLNHDNSRDILHLPEWGENSEKYETLDELGWSLLGWRGGVSMCTSYEQTEPVYGEDVMKDATIPHFHELDSKKHPNLDTVSRTLQPGDRVWFADGKQGIFMGRTGDADESGIHPTAARFIMQHVVNVNMKHSVITDRSITSINGRFGGFGSGNLNSRIVITGTIGSIASAIASVIGLLWKYRNVIITAVVAIIASPWGVFVVENELLFMWNNIIRALYTKGLLVFFKDGDSVEKLFKDWGILQGGITMFLALEATKYILCFVSPLVVFMGSFLVGWLSFVLVIPMVFTVPFGIIVILPLLAIQIAIPYCPPDPLVGGKHLQQTIFMYLRDIMKCFQPDFPPPIGKGAYDGECVTPLDCPGRAPCRCTDKGGQYNSILLNMQDETPCGTDENPTGGCRCWPKLPCEFRFGRFNGLTSPFTADCDDLYGYNIKDIAYFDQPNPWIIAKSSYNNFWIWIRFITRFFSNRPQINGLIFTAIMSFCAIIFLAASVKNALYLFAGTLGVQYGSRIWNNLVVDLILPTLDITNEDGYWPFSTFAGHLLSFIRFDNHSVAEPIGHSGLQEGVCWFFNSASSFAGLSFSFFWFLFWFFMIWYAFGIAVPYLFYLLMLLFKPIIVFYKYSRRKAIRAKGLIMARKYIKDKIPPQVRQNVNRTTERIGAAYNVYAPVVMNELMSLIGRSNAGGDLARPRNFHDEFDHQYHPSITLLNDDDDDDDMWIHKKGE